MDIYSAEERMFHEIEKQELVLLQKEELLYKKKVRFWQVISALLALLSAVLGMF